MKKFGRAGSTFVTVVAAAVALGVATTGGAVAGSLITSKQIKNNTIKSIDVRDGNLTGTDIADGSIKGADIGDGSVGSADLAASSVTATKLGTITRRINTVDIANGAGGAADVSCLAGEKLISGGTDTLGVGTSAGWTLIRSGKLSSGETWSAAARNATGGTASLVVEALCLG